MNVPCIGVSLPPLNLASVPPERQVELFEALAARLDLAAPSGGPVIRQG